MYSFLKNPEGKSRASNLREKRYESIFLSSKDFTSVCLFVKIQSWGWRDLTLHSISFFFSLHSWDFFLFSPSHFVSGDRNCPDRNMRMTSVACCCLFEIRLPCKPSLYSIFYVLSPCALSCLCKQQFCQSHPVIHEEGKQEGRKQSAWGHRQEWI